MPARQASQTWRGITVDGRELAYSNGCENLDTESYRAILEGNGCGLQTVRPVVEIVSQIHYVEPVSLGDTVTRCLRSQTRCGHVTRAPWTLGLSDDVTRSVRMLGSVKA